MTAPATRPLPASPPRVRRRRARTAGRRLLSVCGALVLAALALVLVLAAAVSSPLWLLAGQRWRPLRFAVYLLVHLLADLTGAAAAGLVRLRCLLDVDPDRRRERMRALDYALLGQLLAFLHGAAVLVFGLRVTVHPEIPAATGPASADQQPQGGGGGVVVLARHAGPGDSILLVHALLRQAGLRPQVVLKDFLRWDPCLDVLISRLPHCFVPIESDERTTAEIGALAAALGPRDALVLFPEGGNFTPGRRQRAIAWLRRNGQFRRAARARREHHVLPPRLPGSLAALEGAAASGSDVVFVAHTGLDRLDSPRRLWRSVPLPAPVRAAWWRVAASDIPKEPQSRTEWLTEQWSSVDEWIARVWERTDDAWTES